MDLELRGTDGRLSAGYQRAATFGPWRLETIGPSLYRLEGHAARVNPAWLGYRPLTLSVRATATSPWMEWSVPEPEAVSVEDGRLTALVAGDFALRAGGG